MTITLNIRAKDIKEAPYWDKGDCPIVRAFKREGYDVYDTGNFITRVSDKKNITAIGNQSYKRLEERVYDMYLYSPFIDSLGEKPQDFTYKLELELAPYAPTKE